MEREFSVSNFYVVAAFTAVIALAAYWMLWGAHPNYQASMQLLVGLGLNAWALTQLRSTSKACSNT